MCSKAARGSRGRAGLGVIVLLASGAGCANVTNYPDPLGPRFAGAYAVEQARDSLKVVSFNLKFARRVREALALFRENPSLRDADIIALQEMNEAAADQLARGLGMNYVYYPAVLLPGVDHNFGNAILSRWPIVEDAKIVLPHRNRFRAMQRIAVAATLRTPRGAVRAYSVHLETIPGLGGARRRDQARAVAEDADRHGYAHVVIGGDFNSRGVVADVFELRGYQWLTRNLGRTISFFAWDHLLVKGLRIREGTRAGRETPRHASDHAPVWADLQFPQ